MSDEAIYKLHTYPSGELEEFEYVQDLVRCKECKFLSDTYPTRCTKHYGMLRHPKDFCSYGEREGE